MVDEVNDPHRVLHGVVRKGNFVEFMDYIIQENGIERCNCKDDTLLADAAAGGDIKIVDYLISMGVDVNSSTTGYMPLYNAIEGSHLEMAKILFENGASLYLLDHTVHNLAIASANGQKDVVENLLLTKIDVDENHGHFETTALCFAALLGHLDVVKLLVDAGADINHCDVNYNSPLIYAVRGHNLDVVEYFMGRVCDMSVLKKSEEDVIIRRLFEAMKIIHSLLIDKSNKHENNEFVGKPIQTSDLTVIKYLNRKDVDIRRHTSLSNAALNGDLLMVYYLTSQGFNVNEIDSEGNTPLINAVRSGDKNIIMKLLRSHADICKSGRNGKTPLSQAVEMRDIHLMKFLLDRRATATVQTAYLKAIQVQDLNIIEFLESNGAVVNITYQNGQTPLSQALDAGNFEVVKHLYWLGADPEVIVNNPRYLMRYITERNSKMVRFLIRKLKVALDVYGNDSFTPLTKSVDTENYSLVKCLIKNGASVNLVDGNLKTALGIAAAKQYFSICRYLIESGADVSLAGPEVAAFGRCNGDFDFFLRKQNIDVSDFKNSSAHEESISVIADYNKSIMTED